MLQQSHPSSQVARSAALAASALLFQGESALLAATSVKSKPERIQSLDIFRGLNIALMIFVNELHEVKGLPWWTYHAPGSTNVMTYVDMIFPGFLIIVGMSLPLALKARINRGDKTPQLLWYVLLRSIALIVLGLILQNAQLADSSLMHTVSSSAWGLLALLAAFLIWMDYPRSENRRHRSLHFGLRVTGIFLLVALVAIFRRADTNTGAAAWLTFDYPEILGIIGYTYLVAGVCYLLTRKWLWAPVAWFVAFLAWNIASAAKLVHASDSWWIFPVGNGSFPALVFAGVLIATLFFLEPRCNTFTRKAVPTLTFGVLCGVAARLLHPLGISKIRATPTWVLYDVAACCAIYCLLYFLCDVKKKIAWAVPFRSSGSNTLLTYLLPDVWRYALGYLGLSRWFTKHLIIGVGGVLRCVAFTALMLCISAVLTRMRLRLQV
jgi:predicted acyltransferase